MKKHITLTNQQGIPLIATNKVRLAEKEIKGELNESLAIHAKHLDSSVTHRVIAKMSNPQTGLIISNILLKISSLKNRKSRKEHEVFRGTEQECKNVMNKIEEITRLNSPELPFTVIEVWLAEQGYC